MEPSFSIAMDESPNPDDVQAVTMGLVQFNRQHVPDDQFDRIAIFLRRADQSLAGGLLGETYWGWLHIDILWLDEQARGQGFGRKLLLTAENEAFRRGCHHVHLDTMDWQALPFYEKQGYSLFGILDDIPLGHKRFFLSKPLTPSSIP
jgi:GNAT superfamily N-acetyltransferase